MGRKRKIKAGRGKGNKHSRITEQSNTADSGAKPVVKRESPVQFSVSMICTLVVAFFVLTFNLQAFEIPSGSMEPTLLIGDHILVNKFLYHFTSPGRFDVIVFKYPWEDDRDFIKRVIALPGDQVQVRNKVVSAYQEIMKMQV